MKKRLFLLNVLVPTIAFSSGAYQPLTMGSAAFQASRMATALPPSLPQLPKAQAPQSQSSIEISIDPRHIKSTFINALNSAKQQIIIFSPYLSDNNLRENGVLEVLHKRPKDVRVMVYTCASSDRKTQPHEARAVSLLESLRIPVIFMQKVHAKFVLVDDHTVLMGSFNYGSGSLDPRNKYYRTDITAKLTGPLAKACFEHCAAITKSKVLKYTFVDGANIFSQPKEITDLHRHLLSSATESLEISSPCVSYKMLQSSGFLELLKRKIKDDHVNVTIYTDDKMGITPSNYGTVPDSKAARANLIDIGVRLIVKENIHLKFIIVDGKGLFFGSGNIFAISDDQGVGIKSELGVYVLDSPDEIFKIRGALAGRKTVDEVIKQVPAAASIPANVSARRVPLEVDITDEDLVAATVKWEAEQAAKAASAPMVVASAAAPVSAQLPAAEASAAPEVLPSSQAFSVASTLRLPDDEIEVVPQNIGDMPIVPGELGLLVANKVDDNAVDRRDGISLGSQDTGESSEGSSRPSDADDEDSEEDDSMVSGSGSVSSRSSGSGSGSSSNGDAADDADSADGSESQGSESSASSSEIVPTQPGRLKKPRIINSDGSVS